MPSGFEYLPALDWISSSFVYSTHSVYVYLLLPNIVGNYLKLLNSKVIMLAVVSMYPNHYWDMLKLVKNWLKPLNNVVCDYIHNSKFTKRQPWKLTWNHKSANTCQTIEFGSSVTTSTWPQRWVFTSLYNNVTILPPELCGEDGVSVVHAVPIDQTLQGEGHIHDHLKASPVFQLPAASRKIITLSRNDTFPMGHPRYGEFDIYPLVIEQNYELNHHYELF